MTGKRYYLTTLGAWQQHAARFANSHFIVLDAPGAPDDGAASSAPTSMSAGLKAAATTSAEAIPSPALPDNATGAAAGASPELHGTAPADDANAGSDQAQAAENDPRILVLIEADEGVHLSLEDESAFEALPHPLAQKPISDAAHAALAPHGVAPGATTFDAAEALARIHPLLRHRVF